MADTTSERPAGATRRFASLLYEAPYLLLIVLGLVGISWTSVSRSPATTYWVVLTPIAALVCIFAGWRHCPPDARLRMIASQVLHWAAVLLAMYPAAARPRRAPARRHPVADPPRSQSGRLTA